MEIFKENLPTSDEVIVTFYTNIASSALTLPPVNAASTSFSWDISDTQFLTVPPGIKETHPLVIAQEVIANAVARFKADDLPLLYKVLDDPAAFDISIQPGAFYLPDRKHACIIGALAVSKLPPNVDPDQILVESIRITEEGCHMLGLLDMIIKEHLPAFKEEVQRQMASRD